MERLLATLSGKALDRRLVIPVMSLYGARLTGCATADYFNDPAAYARGQAAVLEEFTPDVLLAPMALALLGEAFGSQLHEFAEGPPNVRRPAIQSVAEWDGIEIPDPAAHPRLRYFTDAVKLMAERTAGRTPIAIMLAAPSDIPVLIMGMDAWMEAVLFEPERAQRVIDATIPFFLALSNSLFAAGVTVIVLPCGLLSPAIATRELGCNMVRPSLERALAQLKGPVLLHHTGGPILPNLDLMTGLPATAGFAIDAADDSDRAREIVGPEALLVTGPHGPSLPSMSVAEVESACLKMLEQRRGDAHFGIATTGPDLPWVTPAENIHALRRAVEEHAGMRP